MITCSVCFGRKILWDCGHQNAEHSSCLQGADPSTWKHWEQEHIHQI